MLEGQAVNVRNSWQISTTLRQPTIILLEWPEDDGLAGVTYAQLPDNLSAQYIESMSELYAEVPPPPLSFP